MEKELTSKPRDFCNELAVALRSPALLSDSKAELGLSFSPAYQWV